MQINALFLSFKPFTIVFLDGISTARSFPPPIERRQIKTGIELMGDIHGGGADR